MRKIDLIVIHCSATRCNQDYSFEQLDRDHRARGFRYGCGYHYYVTRDGQLYFGRPEEIVGAHAKGYNAHSIGVCYEGGLDEQGKPADTRTALQKETLVHLLQALKVDYPLARIVGHRDLPDVHKACPCFDVQGAYRDL